MAGTSKGGLGGDMVSRDRQKAGINKYRLCNSRHRANETNKLFSCYAIQGGICRRGSSFHATPYVVAP